MYLYFISLLFIISPIIINVSSVNTCPFDVAAVGRTECPGAYGGITMTACENLGCCMNDEEWNVPWCITIPTADPSTQPTAQPSEYPTTSEPS